MRRALYALWDSPHKALALAAGMGTVAVFDAPITGSHRTWAITLLAGLAALDLAGLWVRRHDRKYWILTVTTPDGSPYLPPWGRDEGVTIYDLGDLEQRAQLVRDAGLVPHIEEV
ncbi:hypothetical protein ACWGB8_01860 [Kitasatospora sp. NPDC054939]